jgi:hypothetical protein
MFQLPIRMLGWMLSPQQHISLLLLQAAHPELEYDQISEIEEIDQSSIEGTGVRSYMESSRLSLWQFFAPY